MFLFFFFRKKYLVQFNCCVAEIKNSLNMFFGDFWTFLKKHWFGHSRNPPQNRMVDKTDDIKNSLLLRQRNTN